MDSFEASSQFSQILSGLNPALANLTKAAHFALKYSRSEDYLFPVIIDHLNNEKVELNSKSTIFQFVEVLIHESFHYSQQPKSNYSFPYIQSLKQSLPSMIYAVVPVSNSCNLYGVSQSLLNISKVFKVNCDEYQKKFNSDLLDEQMISNIDENIAPPDLELTDYLQENDSLVAAWNLLIDIKRISQYNRARMLKHSEVIEEKILEDKMFTLKDKEYPLSELLSKKQIIMRMEDDREVHKRSKESLWLTARPKDSSQVTENEFLDSYWKKFKSLDEDGDKALLDSFEQLNGLVAESYKDSF